MRLRFWFVGFAVVTFGWSSSCHRCGTCSGDDGTEALEQELAEVTAERDALAPQAEKGAERCDKALTVLAEITAILDDPGSFGTEDEVADPPHDPGDNRPWLA